MISTKPQSTRCKSRTCYKLQY